MNMLSNRIGYTLVEVLLVLTLSAAMMGFAIGWIHQSFKAGSTFRQRDVEHRNLSRLARQLREDVHQANTFTTHSDPPSLALTAAQRTISYEIAASGIERREVTSDSALRREFFHLSSSAEARFEIGDPPEQLVQLIITRVDPMSSSEALQTSTDPIIENEHGLVDLHLRVVPDRWNRMRWKVSDSSKETSQ